MASEQEEVAGLDRVLTRLALTEEVNLEKVLQKLLPAVIGMLKSPHGKTRAKILEVLSHVNKRVKERKGIRLPLPALLALWADAAAAPMTRNFALVYAEMAFPGAPPEEQLAAVGALLAGLSQRPAQHRSICLRLAMAGLAVAPAPNASARELAAVGLSANARAARLPAALPAAVADRQLLLEHALKLLLYQPPSTGRSMVRQTPLSMAAPIDQAAGSAPAPSPAGLSAADVKLLEEKGVPSPEGLARQKLGLLNFLHAAATPAAATSGPGSLLGVQGAAAANGSGSDDRSGAAAEAAASGSAGGAEGAGPAAGAGGNAAGGMVPLTPVQLLLPLLVASCDNNEAVARRGDELLKRLCNPEGAKPGVDLENAALVARLYVLLLGGQGEQGTASAPAQQPQAAEGQQATPASAALAQRIMTLLVRSVAAANQFPASAQAMSACLYGSSGGSTGGASVAINGSSGTTQRLRQLGMEFTVWVFKHAPLWQLKAMAPLVMRRLMGGLGLPESALSGQGPDAAAGAAGAEGGAVLEELAPGAGGQSAAALAMRGFAYQAVAQLSQRLPEYFASNAAIARHFFAALATEPAGLRATVQEALSMLAAAYAAGNGSGGTEPAAGAVVLAGSAVGQELEALLLECAKSQQDSVRLCAVQWAARLFPSTHVPSRYICVLGAGDVKQEVREAALKGLQQHPAQRQQQQAAQQEAQGKAQQPAAAAAQRLFPAPADILAYVVQRHPALNATPDPGRSLQLPPKSFQALITFLKAACAEAAATAAGVHGTGDPEVLPDAPGTSANDQERGAYVQLLEHALCREAPAELTVAALEAMVDVAVEGPVARKELAQRYSTRLQWLRTLVSHTDASARAAAARLLGLAATALEPSAAAALLQQLLASFPPSSGPAAGAKGQESGPLSVLGRPAVGSSSRYEEQDGSLLAAGFTAAHLRTGPASAEGDVTSAIDATAAALVAALSSKSPGLSGSAALALGHLGLAGPLPAVAAAAAAAAAADSTTGSSASGATGATAEASAVSSRGAGATPNGSSSSQAASPAGAEAVVTALLTVARDPKVDHRTAVRAITAVGYLAHGNASSEVLQPAIEGILGLAAAKKGEEVVIAAGEALALAFGAVPVTADTILASNFSSLGTSLPESVLSVAPAAQPAVDAMQVDSAATSGTNSAGSAAASPAQAAVRSALLDRLTTELALSPKAEVRSAAAVWLVSLLTYCGAAAELRERERLSQLQATFSALLGDADDLTQEMASRGVSLVYRLGGPEARKKLVEALVGVLQGTNAAGGQRAVKVTGDTKVFEEGAIGSAPGGGGLSTYKELCALATDLGQPDLIYKFMDLANHAAAVNNRRGAAFGVAGIARLISGSSASGSSSSSSSSSSDGFGALGELIGRQQLLALLPKLYRYQFDPNPRVQESMGAIWAALIDDPRKALDEHFDVVMADVLKEMGARLWRSRQASCAALADLLQGRRWAQLGAHFTQVWSMTLRAMDDVKESVRTAAATLCRTVKGLTLRLVNTDYSTPAEARAAVSATLPLLLEVGLPSNVAEVQIVALDTIAKIVKGAGAEQVRPLLPALVRAMLEALSGLEDARLNYVEQHAERIGLDADRLEGARVAASRASPASETLDLAVRCVDAASMQALVPVLVELIRRGVGLNTKAGTARFIRSLTTRLGPDMRPTAPQLLKALTASVRSEHSGSVRRGYAAAAAAVVKYAAEKRQERLVQDALAMYGSLEENETPPAGAERVGGGLLLRELQRAAPDVFNRYSDQILPVAFAARLDDDRSAAAAWAAVWEEGAPSEGAAVRSHLEAVVGVVASGLGSQQWGRKKACAEALTSLCELAGSTLSPHAPRLAALLMRESGGRLWDGKESILTALGALCSACCATLSADPGLQVLVDALLSVVGRKKSSYRAAALAALEKVLNAVAPLVTGGTAQQRAGGAAAAAAVSTEGLYDRVAPPLLDACRRHASGSASSSKPAAPSDADASAGDADAAAAADKPLPLPESLRCLAAAWKIAPEATKAARGHELAATIAAVMRAPGLPWTGWAAAAATAQAIVQDAVPALQAAEASGSGAQAWLPPLLLGLGSACANTAVGQVRSATLDAIKQLLHATDGGRRLPADATVSGAASAAAAAAAAGGLDAGAGSTEGAPAAGSAAAPPVPGALPGAEGGNEPLLTWLRRVLREVSQAEKAPAVRAQAIAVLATVADDMQTD